MCHRLCRKLHMSKLLQELLLDSRFSTAMGVMLGCMRGAQVGLVGLKLLRQCLLQVLSQQHPQIHAYRLRLTSR